MQQNSGSYLGTNFLLQNCCVNLINDLIIAAQIDSRIVIVHSISLNHFYWWHPKPCLFLYLTFVAWQQTHKCPSQNITTGRASQAIASINFFHDSYFLFFLHVHSFSQLLCTLVHCIYSNGTNLEDRSVFASM